MVRSQAELGIAVAADGRRDTPERRSLPSRRGVRRCGLPPDLKLATIRPQERNKMVLRLWLQARGKVFAADFASCGMPEEAFESAQFGNTAADLPGALMMRKSTLY